MPYHRWPVFAAAFAVLVGIPLLEEPVLGGARGVGYAVCHQLPSHSFFAGGEQLPLCARCTGIYLGFLVGVAGMALLGKLGATRLPPRPVVAVLVVAMVAMVFDGFNSLTTALPESIQAYQPTNLLRLATGLGAGASLALLMVPTLNDSLWTTPDTSESVSDMPELLGFVIIAALVGALVYSENPVILMPVSILGTVGVFATLGTAGTALAATLLRRERMARNLREAVPLFVTGLGLSIAAMVALGALRYFYSVNVGI